MYQIVICDDSIADLEMIQKRITENPAFEEGMNIECYFGGDAFLDTRKEKVDLLILDMQMGDLSGYETAEKFRKVSKQTVLAFCSAVCMPQPEHFNVQPYRYILKQQPAWQWEKVITELLEEMKRRSERKYIRVTEDGKAILLEPDDILYLVKQKRGSRIVLNRNSELTMELSQVCVRETLKELEKELENLGFAKPHTSYLVNLKMIRAVDSQELLLDNGERISITRSCKEEFHRTFSAFFSRKYRRERNE